MPAPRVSILTPAYNAATVLARAVASVRAQTLPDWELIIVDDGSADDTVAQARALARQDPRIRVFEQPGNTGAARARNRALAEAGGRYIAFLDADDSWMPDKLTRQIGFMQARGAALSYTGFWRVRAGQQREVQVPETVDYHGLLKGNVIGCLTAIYDREVLGTVEMPPIRLRQDYALWLHILKRIPLAHGLCEPLASYHVQQGSLSSNRLRGIAATWAIYREIEGLNRPRALRCLGSHLIGRLRRG